MLFVSSEPFLRIDADSDLMNPAQWTDYAWKEEIYQCHCPSVNSSIENKELTYESDSSKHYNIYTRVLNCTMEHKCELDHDGGNWTGSLLPDHAIHNVTMQAAYVNVNSFAMLGFQCLFDAKDGLLYNITW